VTLEDLSTRNIVLGVSGGIAAYKSAELVRLLKKAGAAVQVVMTPAATQFISPLTLGTLSEREVLIKIFPKNEQGSWTKHVSLGLWADMMIVAPATAQTVARLAHGFCDSMLTAVALAARCPILVCPAMDHDMFVHPATQANLETLAEYGYRVMPPDHGELASGLVGEGRLPEPQAILEQVISVLDHEGEAGDFSGRKVLVTAGPTRESIDPVRYITNRSSGKMGFALAAAAERRGANVVLVSGPVALATPPGVRRVDVTTAEDMYRAVFEHVDADVVVMAAAVADYTAEAATSKIKKSGDELVLKFHRTRDILAELGASRREEQVLVGFALETDNDIENAHRKLEEKHLDLVAVNNPRDEGAAFGHDTNRVRLLGRGGDVEDLGKQSKERIAGLILDRVQTLLASWIAG
jgi:phosphopantothenoylcysteine decarboxylase/phosphopantothenate--cysteine ligase